MVPAEYYVEELWAALDQKMQHSGCGRILAQQLCERVRKNRKLWYSDKTVGYMIARESSKDSSSKLLDCTEAIVALMMQTRLMTTSAAQCQDEITTAVVDEVHSAIVGQLIVITS